MVREGRAGTEGLKARDFPRGRRSRETEGIERLIWYSSYVLCPSLVWTVSEGGWGWSDTLEQTRTHMHTEAEHVWTPFLVLKCRRLEGVGVFVVILLTCDFPNCTEYVEFLWVQSFNIVIDISVNKYGMKEKKNPITINICNLFAKQGIHAEWSS